MSRIEHAFAHRRASACFRVLCVGLALAATFFHADAARADTISFAPLVWGNALEPPPTTTAEPTTHTPTRAGTTTSDPPISPPPIASMAPRSRPPSDSSRPTTYDPLIASVANDFGLDADLLHAIVRTESDYDASAVSPKGAIGLMQVMPATGRRFGFADLRDPKTNLSAGATYLRWLLDRFGNDLSLALAAYNAGERAVERYGADVPPFPETRDYVASVMSRYRASQSSARQSGMRMARSAPPTLSAPGSGSDSAPRTAAPLAPLRLLEKLGSLILSGPSPMHVERTRGRD